MGQPHLTTFAVVKKYVINKKINYNNNIIKTIVGGGSSQSSQVPTIVP